MNLIHWLDDLVVLNAKGDHSLVYTTSGIKEDGFYQKLGGAQHTIIEAKLSSLRQLHTECDVNNLSAGKYYAVYIYTCIYIYIYIYTHMYIYKYESIDD